MIIPMGKSFMIIPDTKVDLDGVVGNSTKDIPIWLGVLLIAVVFILFGFVIRELTRD